MAEIEARWTTALPRLVVDMVHAGSVLLLRGRFFLEVALDGALLKIGEEAGVLAPVAAAAVGRAVVFALTVLAHALVALLLERIAGHVVIAAALLLIRGPV